MITDKMGIRRILDQDDRKSILVAWKLMVKHDRGLAALWKKWEWRSDENRAELLKCYESFYIDQGWTVDKLLRSLKHCVVNDQKWTLPNVDRAKSTDVVINLSNGDHTIAYLMADRGLMVHPEAGLEEAIMSYYFGDD